MSRSSSEVEETNATVGLTTPMLNDGERFNNARSEQVQNANKEHTDSTVFDIALDIDAKTKQLLQSMQENEKAIDERLEQMTSRIKNLKQYT